MSEAATPDPGSIQELLSAMYERRGEDMVLEDLTVLIAVAEVAVKPHLSPVVTEWGPACRTCWTRSGGRAVWPCDPLVDITAALLGETT